MKQFVNYHNHTVYSLLDGYSKVEQYCDRAKQMGQPAVTISDHGNMFGALDFYDAAMASGVKPFLGQEFYQARKTRFDKDGEERASGSANEWGQRGPYHCGIIAYNNVGYHNLIKLSSRAFTEGYFVKPRIDHELLTQHHDGLVMLSGCLSGEIQQALLRDDYGFALETAAKMQSIFGKENYFIEVMNHGIEEEIRNYPLLLKIAKDIGAPVIATNDSHYTTKGDAHFHDVMLCVNTGSRLDTPDRFKFSEDEFYLKSFDEMTSIFPEEFITNTLLIYDKHDLNLKFEEFHFPHFPLPEGFTADSYFSHLVYEGAKRRFGEGYRADKVIMDRLEYEIQVILQMGFPNYFLVVADIVSWAKDNGILVGLGRGSAAGSLAAYCMRITEVNPLDYDLPFERFLVPGRKSMPDIDLDFDDRFRQDVIEYTRQKYGHDHTANIATFNKIGAKKAVRDAARVLGYEFDVGDKIAKVMPPPVFGVAKSLQECLETEEFFKLYNSDEDVKNVVDTALGLEGLIRETSVHAAGLVVADAPITNYVPVMQKGPEATVITQYDMHRMEQNGLLKIDFLGLRNLSIVDMCLKNIERTTGEKIDIYEIPKIYDQKTFDSLSRGENVGVFQVESAGIKELLVGLKPSEVEDLVAILALYRPGPMGSNVHNEFVDRKHKRKPVKFLHESLKGPLANTFGLLLYQEQLLAIARNVAGFDVGEADDLRKVVGKKQTEKMPKFRAKFIDGCVKTVGMNRSTADQLFNEIEHHASYSFSKNHSVPYGLLSYITAYLRVNYPVEYMAAALSTVQDNEERLRLYLEGSKSLGLSVLPPSINYSDYNFAVKSEDEIVYGFSAISGIGEVLANKMVDTRTEDYTSLYDFMRRVDVDILNKKIIEHFTASGCFDELIAEVDIPSLSKMEKMSVLQQESEELGIFLTDHPLNDIYDIVIDKITHNIDQLDDASIGNVVKLSGVVVSFAKKMTKRGKKMYKLKLEDLTDSIYVDIFPAKAETIEDDEIQKGDILVIEGKPARVSDDENSTISLRYNSHEKIDISDAIGTKPIFLTFQAKPHYEQIKKIHDIIDHNQGESSVFLSFKDGRNIVKLKFLKTTNPEIENVLKTICEVVS